MVEGYVMLYYLITFTFIGGLVGGAPTLNPPKTTSGCGTQQVCNHQIVVILSKEV